MNLICDGGQPDLTGGRLGGPSWFTCPFRYLHDSESDADLLFSSLQAPRLVEMKVALLILSDVHFSSDEENLPIARASLIAGAVSSENVQLDGLVILLPGDIADSGVTAE